jgi:hypothetical protein
VLCRLRNRLRRRSQALLHIINRVLRVRFVFERHGTICRELDLAEGLEQVDQVEMGRADDDVVGLGLAFFYVFDVEGENSWAQLGGPLDRVFVAAEGVAGVDAGAD